MSKAMAYIADRMEQEEGEISSWLILAAGLCAAAAAASGILMGIITGLASAVG